MGNYIHIAVHLAGQPYHIRSANKEIQDIPVQVKSD